MMARNHNRVSTRRLLALAITGALMVPAAGAATSDYAQGRVLVKFNQGVAESEVAQLLKANMGVEVKQIGAIGLRVVQVPARFESSLAAHLSQDPRVQFAEVDAAAQPRAMTANDQYYGYAWHLPKIGAPAAWDYSLGRDVIVAVVDSGVDGTHPDLVANLIPGYNAVSKNTDTTDLYGHGTKVAGVIGATSNNGLGVTGIAWDVSIMPVRISEAIDGSAYTSDIVAGLTWAADHGARVANVSYALSADAPLSAAAAYARGKGCLVIMPSGNDGVSAGSSDNPNVLTVSATDTGDAITSWSTYGPGVDLSAPGTGIVTTSVGGYYASATGTSFAAPVVAGVAALVVGANPALTAADVEQILEQSAVDLGATGRDPYYGYGRVNAAAAVQMALAWTPTAPEIKPAPDTTVPTVAIASPSAGAKVAGTVGVQITSSDNLGVVAVKLYAGSTLIGTATAAPYAVNLNTTTYANGTLQLSARAYDAAGNEGLGSAVNVTVSNVAKDTTPPTATITAPTANRTVSGTLSVTSIAGDNVKVAAMTLYVDNVQLCTGTSTALNCSWNSASATRGTHVIKLTAVDTSGNATSAQVSVKR